MSFRNVYYDKKKNQIHLWYTVKGKRTYDVYNWVPYVYTIVHKKTNITSIYGENVVRKKFKNWYEYNEFQKNNKCYENKVIPEIQFLCEKYSKIPDNELEVPDLKIFSLDIETHSFEMPSPNNPSDPIVLITVYDCNNQIAYTFGNKPYDPEHSELNDINIQYFYYSDEQQLLKNFINFIHNQKPDVITGWNIIPNKKMNVSGFDMVYIINRCKMLFGNKDTLYKKLSPINEVKCWEDNERNINVDVVGISLIDYLSTYKWYSRKKPESYSLEFVSNLELGTGKLEYEGSLHQLYENNWTKMVDYNIIDTVRVKELEDKLGYIKLIQSLSLITKCPMKYFNNMTTLIEGLMLTYYRRNELCAPRMIKYDKEEYPAGYLKEPHKGLFKWLFSIDIASSYPTAIITLNQSLETYIGKIISFNEQKIVEYTSNREFPEFELLNFYTNELKKFKGNKLKKFNMLLKKGLICISPSGVCFKTQPEGVIAHVERSMYNQRKSIKKEMRQVEDKNLKSQLNHKQNAIKTLINSFYGILAYPYRNRYVNIHIAESITSCGRHAIKQSEKYVNELLNNPNNNLNSILMEMENK